MTNTITKSPLRHADRRHELAPRGPDSAEDVHAMPYTEC